MFQKPLRLHVTFIQNIKNNIVSENISSLNSNVCSTPFFSVVSLMKLTFVDATVFVQNANLHNFADDNTLTTFAQNIRTLKPGFEFESNIAIDWILKKQNDCQSG